MSPLVQDAQDDERATCRVNGRKEDDVSTVVHRAHPLAEQVTTASRHRVRLDLLQRAHQAAVAIEPLRPAPPFQRVGADLLEILARPVGEFHRQIRL